MYCYILTILVIEIYINYLFKTYIHEIYKYPPDNPVVLTRSAFADWLKQQQKPRIQSSAGFLLIMQYMYELFSLNFLCSFFV